MSVSQTPARLAVVVSHPTQYYSPWFRFLTERGDLGLRVFYLWNFGVTAQRDPRFQTTFQWDVDLLSGYESEFIPNVARQPGAESFFGFNNPGLNRAVEDWRPDAVLVFGYRYLSHVRLIRWARRARLPLLFRGDSHFLGRPVPPGFRRSLLRWVYRQFSAVTYVGAANRDYFTALGVPETKLFFAPHAIDDRRFDPAAPGLADAVTRLRHTLNLAADKRVVLFAGKFVPAKQPRLLLQAFLAANLPNTALVFVGDGPENAALRAAAPPGREVFFLPFANQSQMPAIYALADLFVLPSCGYYETWGLAVNEAMQMGVPCLVSDRVGCQRDLVIEGDTGWVFSHASADHLRDKLVEATQALTSDATAWRNRARGRVALYSYAAAAAGLVRAVRHVVPATRP